MKVAGPLAPLMALPMAELTGARVAAWLSSEKVKRPVSALISFRLLRAFIRWAADMEQFQGIIPADAYGSRAVRDVIPRSKAKDGDCLQREQLPTWFAAVRELYR